jgi:hypothetical protein
MPSPTSQTQTPHFAYRAQKLQRIVFRLQKSSANTSSLALLTYLLAIKINFITTFT